MVVCFQVFGKGVAHSSSKSSWCVVFHSIAVSSSRSYNNCKREKGASLWFAQRGMQTLCAPMVVAELLRSPSSKTACSPSSILFLFRSVNCFSKVTLVLHSKILNVWLLQRLHNITQLMSCVIGPAIDSRIKPPDAGIPVLQTELEGRAAEHSSSAE